MKTGLFLGREPVLWMELVKAILPVAVLFGLPLTAEQTAGLLLVWGAILALITRSAVTPNVAVAERVDKAGVVRAGPANDLEPNGAKVRTVGDDDQPVDPLSGGAVPYDLRGPDEQVDPHRRA